jgi:4-amino-4-deoxy-L-arabinose transferase-like glycosyltransferase
MKPRRSLLLTGWYLLALLLAVITYFYGLDSQHIPKNGDEYPYEHITRLTAASDHWLPLQSQLDGMRNTKPPLLFWQGIVSTDWGQQWTQWNLRYPSVIYTLLTALLVLLLARKLSSSLETGLLAALTYLAFFSTYHYGRPYLTNPPEVFWFFLPFFCLLYWQPKSFESRLFVPLGLGLAFGIGFLYKSFALALPVSVGLTAWYLQRRQYHIVDFLWRDSWKVALSVSTALAVFALWFAIDPDPQAVWKEFVIGENAGKFGAGGSYLAKLLWSGSSVGTLALDFFLNAGFLIFPVMGLFFVTFKRRRELSDGEKLLWFWFIALFISFSLPSQRSSRYLLSGMPAIAVLCALNWPLIGRRLFVASLLLALVALGGTAYLAVRLQAETADASLFATGYWFLLAGSALLLLAAVFVPRLTRATFNAAVLLVLLCLAAFLAPFDGAQGNYDATAKQYASGRPVWVPCDYRANDERYRFILPGADIHGYRDDRGLTAAQIGQRYRLVALQLPLGQTACDDCRVIGQRLDLRGRQSAAEVEDMLRGRVFEHLFVREWLIETKAPTSPAAPDPALEGCR